MDSKTIRPMKHDLFIFCGEPSGDLHGESLIQSLLKQNPRLKIFGVGGPRMRKTPFRTILPMEEFQVMGFTDVFFELPKILRHFYSLAHLLLKEKPPAVVFIDYPGFSLRIERYLRKKGYCGKIIHYICPSVWAHGKGRIALLEKNVDLLLAIFPFEPKLFPPSFPIHYVGHPLVSRFQENPSPHLPWGKDKKIISIFPGSRKKEILLNFPLQLKAFRAVCSEDVIGAISVSEPSFLPLLEECILKEGLQIGKSLKWVFAQDTYALMQSSYCAIAKSGTVTLELALHKIPTVVTYGIAPLDLFIVKYLYRISLPFYCIVNIICQKEVFKELFGPFLTEKNLIQELENLLLPEHHAQKQSLCLEVEQILGNKKASQESARLIELLL
ncbi:MAG: lipid-A-disaccharide synthase [Rhabdochlamydiaceae bacterium]|nr:lipid-A-disaccharide synthase [Rhabdochlamydiaceae bacterium]